MKVTFQPLTELKMTAIGLAARDRKSPTMPLLMAMVDVSCLAPSPSGDRSELREIFEAHTEAAIDRKNALVALN